MAHASKESPKDGLKPVAYVYDYAALRKGEPYPPSFKVYRTETGGNLVPVAHYGPTDKRSYLVRAEGKIVRIFSFKTPTDFGQVPKLDQVAAFLNSAPGSLVSGLVYRNKRLYFASMQDRSFLKAVLGVPSGSPPLYIVHVVRIRLLTPGDGPPFVNQLSIDEHEIGLRDFFEDDLADVVSFERPALAVTIEGDMVVMYGCIGLRTAQTIRPECRYNVIYADERGPQGARVLQKGEFSPTRVEEDTNKTVPETYADHLDYATAVLDPSDNRTVWLAYEFPDLQLSIDTDQKHNYKMVVGLVKP
jgi:hypothetical protein